MKMTDSTTQTPENDEVSSLPDASDIDITVIKDSTASEPPNLSFLPDVEDANDSEYHDSNSSVTTSGHQESSDRPSFSNLDDSEYHESNPSTPKISHREVTKESCLSGAGEVDVSGNFESDSNTLTPGNHHVIDQYSFLSDAPDAQNIEDSRNFETNPNVSTPNHLQVINQSFLADASEISDTTIKMESPQASTSGSRSFVPEASEVGNSGRVTEDSRHSEALGHSKILTSFYKKYLL